MANVRENEVDENSNDEDNEGPSQRKKLSNDEEDKLIAIILRYYDILENKQTDKSLTPKKLREAQSNAWLTIQAEFKDETMVSNFKVMYSCFYFCFILNTISFIIFFK